MGGWATEKPQRVKKQEVLGLEGGGLERGGNRAGDTHADPHSQARKPRMHPP